MAPTGLTAGSGRSAGLHLPCRLLGRECFSRHDERVGEYLSVAKDGREGLKGSGGGFPRFRLYLPCGHSISHNWLLVLRDARFLSMMSSVGTFCCADHARLFFRAMHHNTK